MTDWDHRRMDEMRQRTWENRKRVIEDRERRGIPTPDWALRTMVAGCYSPGTPEGAFFKSEVLKALGEREKKAGAPKDPRP